MNAVGAAEFLESIDERLNILFCFLSFFANIFHEFLDLIVGFEVEEGFVPIFYFGHFFADNLKIGLYVSIDLKIIGELFSVLSSDPDLNGIAVWVEVVVPGILAFHE